MSATRGDAYIATQVGYLQGQVKTNAALKGTIITSGTITPEELAALSDLRGDMSFDQKTPKTAKVIRYSNLPEQGISEMLVLTPSSAFTNTSLMYGITNVNTDYGKPTQRLNMKVAGLDAALDGAFQFNSAKSFIANNKTFQVFGTASNGKTASETIDAFFANSSNTATTLGSVKTLDGFFVVACA